MISGGGTTGDKTQNTLSAISAAAATLSNRAIGTTYAVQVTGAGVISRIMWSDAATDEVCTIQLWLDGVMVRSWAKADSGGYDMLADALPIRRAFPNGLYFASSLDIRKVVTIAGTVGTITVTYEVAVFA